ncbi:MFS transporter [Parapedobacter sp. GCM10030251]|uniref:MFS transporter n=1 Tax=Parapedobacter sp. GCM10030251 TaxID=3273419 RepID=UPI00360BE421
MDNTHTNSPVSNRWLQHFILLSAPLLTVIDVFIVNISIPSIKISLDASDAQVELVIAGYLLGYASLMITGGRAGDFWGRKKVFLWGMFAFIVTSCLCGIATTPAMLIIARFLQGVSGAFMTPQALSYLQVLFPDAGERTKAIGFVGVTLGIASTLGQFLGGYFSSLETSIAGWRFIFFINLPVGLVALWAAKKHLIEIKIPSESRFDMSGVILVILALTTLIFPLTEGRELGWPWWSLAMLVSSIVFFLLFVLSQKKMIKRQKDPLVDLRLFNIRSFSIGILSAAFYFMMHTSYLLVSTIYIQDGLQVDPFQAGLYFVAFGLSFMLSSFLSIRLVQRFGKIPVQTGLVMMMLCFLFQLNLFDGEVMSGTIYMLLFATGFSGGFVLPSLINLSLRDVPRQFTGAASGVYNTTQQAASSIGICLIGGLFFYTLAIGKDFIKAFHMGLYGEIILLSLVFVLLTIPTSIKNNKNN